MIDYWTSQIALVTGSSRGLGRGFATHLLRLGCTVVVHGRTAQSAETGAAALRDLDPSAVDRVLSTHFDVADPAAAEQAIATLSDSHRAPTILINNAGNIWRAPIEDFPVEHWDSIMQTHLSGAFYVSRAVIPGMREAGGGKILNTGSVLAVLARATSVPYGAAKGGLLMLTRGMAVDLARHNIQVNMVSPGYFRTELNADLVADPEFTRWVEERTPAGRWGEVNELGGAMEFLVGPNSGYVTGQDLHVDGGMTISV